jgi:hypothetical protein
MNEIVIQDKIEYMKATDKTLIDRIGIEGRLMDDVFVLNFRNLTFSIEPQFLAITKTSKLSGSYSNPSKLLTENDGNGYVGLAPFSLNNAQHKEYNFMWYLKSQGYIDDIVFSIFTDLDRSDGYDSKPKSHIKIGGYDSNDETLKDGA